MSDYKLKDQYNRDGYIVFPQIFSKEEILRLRKAASEIFSRQIEHEGDRNNIKFNIISRHPEFRLIIKNQKYLAALKSILGEDFVIIPEEGLHVSGVTGGWHRDTGTQELHGQSFQWEPDFNMVNVGIYLQDNHPDFAGGLDVVPGSQKYRATWWEKQRSSNKNLKWIFSKLRKLGLLPGWVTDKRRGAISIETKAGDVLVFDMNIIHRPTNAKKFPIPEQFTKYAYFVICSENNKYARQYTDYIKTRPDYIYMKNFIYPADLLEVAKQSGANLFI